MWSKSHQESTKVKTEVAMLYESQFPMENTAKTKGALIPSPFWNSYFAQSNNFIEFFSHNLFNIHLTDIVSLC